MNSALIQNLLDATALNITNIARMTGIAPKRLHTLYHDALEASASELDSLARALGLELDVMLRGETDGGTGMFFRAIDSSTTFESFANAHDVSVYGNFCRATQRIHRLQHIVDNNNPSPRWLGHTNWSKSIKHQEMPWAQGEALARHARNFFGLGNTPIPSMRDFLRSIDVEVFFLPTEEKLHADVDGACICKPAPAILLNPLYEGSPWRTRATLAHELCHLLIDLNGPNNFLLSRTLPSSTKSQKMSWGELEDYRNMEARANAFAAAFLAPKEGIKELLRKKKIKGNSPNAVLALSSTFGVSNEMAALRLKNINNKSDSWLNKVLSGAKETPHTTGFSYNESTNNDGLFNGKLKNLALKALEQKKISAIEARMYLDIPFTAPLPCGAGAPILSQENLAMKHAMRLLFENEIFVGASTLRVERVENGWCVYVQEPEQNNEQPKFLMNLDFTNMTPLSADE